jgi:MoxR-like ATPase
VLKCNRFSFSQDEGGQLTEAVRRAPHSVVLLDEMEKAHGDVLNILLQILEDGQLTDGKGRVVDFSNVILVMTSNVGSKRILDVASGGESEDRSDAQAEIMSKLKSSPDATKLMKEAAEDELLKDAVEKASKGSSDDLARLAQEDPKVAAFLEKMWTTLDMDGKLILFHLNEGSSFPIGS